jgi:hypothetical protein
MDICSTPLCAKLLKARSASAGPFTFQRYRKTLRPSVVIGPSIGSHQYLVTDLHSGRADSSSFATFFKRNANPGAGISISKASVPSSLFNCK